ncbi:MAG TPA: response regulator [Bryobacteraceae bacterium]|nr:response regulator [Bryobacteraceae bacterium]
MATLWKDKAFLFALAALAAILSLAYWDWREFKTAGVRVQETEDSLSRIEAIFSTMANAETGERGFLITGDDRYLEPYTEATRNIGRELANADVLRLKQTPLKDSLAELQQKIGEKFADMQQSIDIRRQQGADAAFEQLENGKGKRVMDDIRIYCQTMEDSLRKQLADRNRVAETQTREARIISSGASCLLFILVALATIKFKKEKDSAEAASQIKSSFLANMSHELRTPLNAIIGYSEMVIEEAGDAGQAAIVPDMNKILAAGKQLLGLINSILDLSKIEAGKMELYLETFSVPALVEEVTAVILPLVEKNGNTLKTSVEPGVQSMRADQTKLRQTLYNLLSNASKFTSKGRVDLHVKLLPEERISFEVSDTGIGLTAEEIARLFEPFAQGDASTSRKYGGTGLGLVISRRFAQMMGGDITVTSTKGKGSVFTVTLPQTVEPEAARADDLKAERESLESAGTVLVIDDEPAVHEILERTLAKHGFKVKRASSGEEGLRMARRLRPQIITLDVMMPGMDGWAVLAALKSDPFLAEIPVIMLTIADDKNLGYSLGAADYLTKPIDRERLASVLLRYRRDSGNTVLVVEDDAESREMLVRLLRSDGWSVSEAENGRSAIAQVSGKRPGIILLDLMMPEMDGFEFITEMERRPEWKSIPVIVITARDLTAEDKARLTGHVSRVLQKGLYSRDELLRQISGLVAERIQKRETV